MDPISAIAACAGVVTAAKAIAEFIYEFVEDTMHAAAEMKRLAMELEALQTASRDIQSSKSKEPTIILGPILKECEVELKKLSDKLEVKTGFRKRMQFLVWHWAKSDVEGKIKVFMRYTAIFTLALTSHGIKQIEFTIDSTGKIHEMLSRMEPMLTETYQRLTYARQEQQQQLKRAGRDDALLWLLRTPYMSNYNKKKEERTERTGDWFVEGTVFHSWLWKPDDKHLWLSGIAGTGKSVLMSNIIDATNNSVGKPPIGEEHVSNVGIAFFFFDFKDTKKQDPLNMLLSLIRQFVLQVADLPACVRYLKRETPVGTLPDTTEALKCLVTLCGHFQRSFILLDALDESNPQDDCLKVIKDISERIPSMSRLLVTSRNEMQIQQVLERANFRHVPIPLERVDEDIMLYVSSILDSGLKRRFEALPQDLQEDVKTALRTKSGGMFLMAHWLLHEIFRQRTIAEIRTSLESLPKDVNEIYKRILYQIDRPNSENSDRLRAKRALTWLVVSLSPFNLTSLCDAITIDLDTSAMDYSSRLSDEALLWEICGSLVYLETEQQPTRIGLSHLSIKHFLSSADAGKFRISIPEAHLQVAKACFACISSIILPENPGRKRQGFEKLKFLRRRELGNPRTDWPYLAPDFTSDCSEHFLLYCSQNAFLHLRESRSVSEATTSYFAHLFSVEEFDKKMESLMRWTLELIEPRMESSINSLVNPDRLKGNLMLGPAQRRNKSGLKPETNLKDNKFGSLQMACDSNIVTRLIVCRSTELALGLIEVGFGFTSCDENGWSSLDFAAAYDDGTAVSKMLQLLREMNEVSLPLTSSALILAFAARAKSTAQILIDFVLSAGSSFATEDLDRLCGILTVVSGITGESSQLRTVAGILESCHPELDFWNAEYMQLACICAAAEGHAVFLEAALLEGYKPKSRVECTSLSDLWASAFEDFFGNAALMWRRKKSIELTEQTDDSCGFNAYDSAIAAAARAEIPEIVSMLAISLEYLLDCLPNWTYRHESYLNPSPATDEFQPYESALSSIMHQTHTSLASNRKAEQAVLWCTNAEHRIHLLEKFLSAGVDPTVLSHDGCWTTVTNVVNKGNLQSLLVLLRFGAKINKQVPRGNSALLQAIDQFSIRDDTSGLILDELLARGADVNASRSSQFQSTPLIAACDTFHWARIGNLVRRLLKYGPDPNALRKGRESYTPLLLVCSKMLGTSNKEANPLVIQDLLNAGADPNFRAETGRYGTALIAACAAKRSDVVKILLEHRIKTNPNLEAKSGEFGTALSAATHVGDNSIVKLLLHHGADPSISARPTRIFEDFVGFYGQTEPVERRGNPIMCAIESGNLDVLQILFANAPPTDLEASVSFDTSETPLVAAASRGNTEIVKFLLRKGCKVYPNEGEDTKEGMFAPLQAALNQHSDTFSELLRFVNNTTLQRFAPLWTKAAIINIVEGNSEVFQLLLDAKIDLNIIAPCDSRKYGRYGLPIIAAAKRGDIETLKRLEANGARVDVHNVGRYGNCLTAAAKSGNLDLVNYLLSKGISPNIKDMHRRDWSPFVTAARKGHDEIFSALIRAGGNPDVYYTSTNSDIRDPDFAAHELLHESWADVMRFYHYWQHTNLTAPNFTPSSHLYSDTGLISGHPLIEAIVSNCEPILSILFSRHVDVNMSLSVGILRTPLIAACAHGGDETLEKLLDLGADPYKTVSGDRFGSPAIASVFARNGDPINVLLNRNFDIKPYQRVSACEHGSMLIAKTASLSLGDRCDEEDIGLIKALLEEGCDPRDEVQGSMYGCALVAAASVFDYDAYRLFKSFKGISVNHGCVEGIYGYPLIAALATDCLIHIKYKSNRRIEKAKLDFVEFLLNEECADPNVFFCGRNALVTAIENSRDFKDDLVKLLLEKGADPNMPVSRYANVPTAPRLEDVAPYNAIIAAAVREEYNIVKLLVEHGGDRKHLRPEHLAKLDELNSEVDIAESIDISTLAL